MRLEPSLKRLEPSWCFLKTSWNGKVWKSPFDVFDVASEAYGIQWSIAIITICFTGYTQTTEATGFIAGPSRHMLHWLHPKHLKESTMVLICFTCHTRASDASLAKDTKVAICFTGYTLCRLNMFGWSPYATLATLYVCHTYNIKNHRTAICYTCYTLCN